MNETVLLLHSGGMSGRQWRRLGDELAGSYRVLTPDFLGSGANPPWPQDQEFHFHQDLDILDQLVGDEPFHVVGHSYGGLLALLLARQRHAQVRSVAVYDPVAFGVLVAARDPEGLADLARVEQDPHFLNDATGGDEDWWRAFTGYWNGPGSWETLPEASRASFLRVGRKVFYEVRSLLAERSPASSYAVIEAPAVLMHGEHTPASARRVVQLLGESLPQAHVVSVAGAGHMGPITHAAVVNGLIGDNLRRVPARS